MSDPPIQLPDPPLPKIRSINDFSTFLSALVSSLSPCSKRTYAPVLSRLLSSISTFDTKDKSSNVQRHLATFAALENAAPLKRWTSEGPPTPVKMQTVRNLAGVADTGSGDPVQNYSSAERALGALKIDDGENNIDFDAKVPAIVEAASILQYVVTGLFVLHKYNSLPGDLKQELNLDALGFSADEVPALEYYDSRLRVKLRKLLRNFDEVVEMESIESYADLLINAHLTMVAEQAAEELAGSPSEMNLNKKKRFSSKLKTRAKIFGLTAATATVIAVTGGLAIPFVAAAGSGLVTTIGAGVAGVTGSTAVMTGAVTLATGITVVGGNGVVVGGVLAGVGGGIASKKWKRVLKDEGEAAVR
eukprot:CAMPEP_0182508210 /NCGR_PEP_ID=MMETSP1321-20130603/24571_1 /TAXON_ID=91990 /ORGANISM="Bolidomonas sp., Strain RCC1657" /LENGTH=360 /DNA_ID=CAMNT_0024714249 /DNA_START=130 /DNA_END=1208 /DNA_ORIENTATION=+